MNKKKWLALFVVVLVLSACTPRNKILIDRTMPHKITSPVWVRVMVKLPDGSSVETKVHADAGWWLAAPEVVGK